MATVEESVTALETIIPTLATKEDLSKLEVRLIKWIVGMMLSSVAIATTVAVLIQQIID